MNKQIRADYNKETITVYQAYNQQIALPAIANQRFGAPFSFQRMTWIKPSYLWMMERSGWGPRPTKSIFWAFKIKRAYWEKALSLGVLTSPEKEVYASGAEWEQLFATSQIHVQWDPERNINGEKLAERSIQVGISRHLIEEYNHTWIAEIVDMTPLTRKIYQLKKDGKYAEAKRLLPVERVYEVSADIEKRLGMGKALQ